MNWKVLILVLLALGHGYRLALNILQKRSASNPVPKNVADVYDPETYQRWRAYNGEKSGLGVLSTVISLAVTGLLLGLNVYATFAAWFPEGIFWQMFAVLLLTTTGIGNFGKIRIDPAAAVHCDLHGVAVAVYGVIQAAAFHIKYKLIAAGEQACAVAGRRRQIVGRDNPGCAIWFDMHTKNVTNANANNNHPTAVNVLYLGGHVGSKVTNNLDGKFSGLDEITY